jgi:hypothetical protein
VVSRRKRQAISTFSGSALRRRVRRSSERRRKRQADVLKAIESLRGHYPKHAAAARALAGEYFDSNKVLRQLLQKVGV